MKRAVFNRMSEARKEKFVQIVYKKMHMAGIDTALVALDEGHSFTSGRLGLYCGTGWDKCMISHELAHIIQPNAADFCEMYLSCKGTVRFKVPTKFLFGRMIVEPETDKITRRELDTFALEYVLCKQLGFRTGTLEQFMEDHIGLTKYLPDYYFWTSDEKKAFARAYFKERVVHWGKVDIISRLNKRLKYIRKVADLKARRSWYFEFDSASSSVHKVQVSTW